MPFWRFCRSSLDVSRWRPRKGRHVRSKLVETVQQVDAIMGYDNKSN
jgi:hypothetical protein